jgi:prevent-host-death family protein
MKKQISIRELRQNASAWLKQVQQGESFEITDRGRPVALLVPHIEDPIERMIAEGRIQPARGDFLKLGPPLPPTPGVPLPSEILAEDRSEER